MPLIRAYHGSPRDFERFDTSRIGTGEGAQAYGHGLYFAENEGVARDYRNKLAPNKPDAVKPDNIAMEQYKPAWDDVLHRMYMATGEMPRSSYDVDKWLKAREPFQKELDAITQQMNVDTIARNPSTVYGRMYEVNINADPNTFLLWDKPLSEQPEQIKQAVAIKIKELEASGQPLSQNVLDAHKRGTSTGSQIYNLLGSGTP